MGDICIIMRNLCVDDGITNNTRVLILEINRYRVRCQTLGDNSRSVSLPRIRFNFRLPYGRSFMMTRKQFPLRRAYCLSVHKSQGQTLGRVLVDARAGFFAHGQQYVAVSRVTHYRNIAFAVTSERLFFDPLLLASKRRIAQEVNHDGKLLLFNIVYPEAINELKIAQRRRVTAVRPNVGGAAGGGGGGGGGVSGAIRGGGGSSSSSRHL